ncbi:MAG: phosphopyruvate hydratase [Candidatus Hodarchaeota archaeon]
MKIKKVYARQILDSRGNPTVEVEVVLDKGIVGRAAVPSGASTGTHEALELRDGDKSKYHGKGVQKAIKNIHELITPKILEKEAQNQSEIDNIMIDLDGTQNKSVLGANAILGVSLAVSRAAAKTQNISLYEHVRKIAGLPLDGYLLPVPLSNVINGGKHAGSNLVIQEFMLVPIGFPNMFEGVRGVCEVYQQLKDTIKQKYGKTAVNVGDEGGFAPPMNTSIEALEALVNGVEATGYTPGKDFHFALDSAASEFYDKKTGKYLIDGKFLSREEFVDYYLELADLFPIKIFEDPFEEDDFELFAEFTKKIGDKAQVVGDDLFVTNIDRLKNGIQMNACNSLLLKVNQIGSLTEAIEAAKLSFENNYSVVVSHRSGETEDPYIADLSVALCCGQIKLGAPARSERTAKYNQLLRIEEQLGSMGEYTGKFYRTAWKKYNSKQEI